MKRIVSVVMLLAVFLVGSAFAQEMPMKKILKPDQLTKIEKIRTNYLKQNIDLKAKLKIATLDLRELMRSARVPDVNKVMKKQAEIADIKAQIAKNRLNQQIAIRKILTDEQWKKMQALRANHMRMRMKNRAKGMKHEMREMKGHRAFRRHHPMMRPMPEPPDND